MNTSSEGVACPRCGCRHLPTLYTRRRRRYTVRVRRCRHCGQEIRTREEIEFIRNADALTPWTHHPENPPPPPIAGGAAPPRPVFWQHTQEGEPCPNPPKRSKH